MKYQKRIAARAEVLDACLTNIRENLARLRLRRVHVCRRACMLEMIQDFRDAAQAAIEAVDIMMAAREDECEKAE